MYYLSPPKVNTWLSVLITQLSEIMWYTLKWMPILDPWCATYPQRLDGGGAHLVQPQMVVLHFVSSQRNTEQHLINISNCASKAASI